MKQIYAAALLVFAIVLASCAPEPPPYFTWCYSYDFYDSVDGINIINGDWVDGTGIVTNEDGLIQVNWVEDVEYVDLNQLVVWVQRGAPGSNTFRVSANGIIFGIAAAFDEQFPPYPAPSDFSGRFPVSSVPDPGSVFTNNANITIQADEPFILYSIEVRGIGPNPFGVNTCGDLTPTPEITLPPTVEPATPVATHTPTPTETLEPATFTPSPTQSPTASPTPDCAATWVHVLDFRVAPYAYIIGTNPAKTTYASGQGYKAKFAYDTGLNYSDMSHQVQFMMPAPTHLLDIDVMISTDAGDMARWPSTPGGGLTVSVHWHNTTTPPTAGWTNSSFIEPYTKSETWVSMYNDGVSMPGVTWINVALTTEYGYLPQTSFVNTIHALRLTGTGVNPFTGACVEYPTPTTSPSPTPSLTPSVTNTPLLPTSTLTLTPMPSLTPGTPRPTSTPQPTTAPIFGPTYTYVLGTLPPNVPNTTPGTPVYTSTPLMTITVTPEGTPGDGDGVFVPWGSYSGPDQTQSDIGSIGGALTNVASNLFGVGSRYLNEFTGMIDQIVVGWRTSTPTVIPGMPRCQSDRLRSELCAIYYIIQYTILGDPLGTIVLQVAIIVIDLFIGVTFILLARSILEQLRRILHI